MKTFSELAFQARSIDRCCLTLHGLKTQGHPDYTQYLTMVLGDIRKLEKEFSELVAEEANQQSINDLVDSGGLVDAP